GARSQDYAIRLSVESYRRVSESKRLETVAQDDILAEACALIAKSQCSLRSNDPLNLLPSSIESTGKDSVLNRDVSSIHGKRRIRGRKPFPLAAPNRRSPPNLSLLTEPCGRTQSLTCKVHSGKGLPGRVGCVLGRLIGYQGLFIATEGSRLVLTAKCANRVRGGL